MGQGLGAQGVLSGRGYITMGLTPPDHPTHPGPKDKDQWYDKTLKLPRTVVRGYYGGSIGTEEADDEVQLLFYGENHLEPNLRLVMKVSDWAMVWQGLGKLLQDRFGIVKMVDPSANG